MTRVLRDVFGHFWVYFEDKAFSRLQDFYFKDSKRNLRVLRLWQVSRNKSEISNSTEAFFVVDKIISKPENRYFKNFKNKNRLS